MQAVHLDEVVQACGIGFFELFFLIRFMVPPWSRPPVSIKRAFVYIITRFSCLAAFGMLLLFVELLCVP